MKCDDGTEDFAEFARRSVDTANDIISHIERDVRESQDIVRNRKAVDDSLHNLVGLLSEDNTLLKVRSYF